MAQSYDIKGRRTKIPGHTPSAQEPPYPPKPPAKPPVGVLIIDEATDFTKADRERAIRAIKD